MQAPHNSIETMPANQFASINRHPNNTGQRNEEKVNFKRTQTIARDSPTRNSTQSAYGKEQRRGKQTVSIDSASNAATKQRSDNKSNKFFLWCTQCFRRQKSKETASGKSKEGFWKRMKKKCAKRKKKTRVSGGKGRTPSRESEETVEETSRKRRKKREKVKRSKDSKRSGESRSRQRKKADSLETPAISGPVFQADQDEKVISDHTLEKDPDFAKSCCYLCAKNTLALAGAIASKVEKAHVSIQASTQYFREDKSCSPEVHVRTVKSSVKVKMRDMSTLHPEKKKSKKPKFKLKLKRPDIIPRIRFPIQPKVRTVACETDKSVRNHNVPQCRAKRGTHCVTENK